MRNILAEGSEFHSSYHFARVVAVCAEGGEINAAKVAETASLTMSPVLATDAAPATTSGDPGPAGDVCDVALG